MILKIEFSVELNGVQHDLDHITRMKLAGVYSMKLVTSIQ